MSLSVGYLISFKRSRRIERRVRGARKRDGLAQRRPKDEIDFSTERCGLARGLYTKDGILNQWPERVRIVFMALFVAYLLAIFYRSYRSPLKLPVLADVCDSDSSFSCAIRLWREKRKRERPEHSLMRDLFIMPVEATPSRDAPLLLLLLPYKDQSHFSLLMAKDKAERKTRELFEK